MRIYKVLSYYEDLWTLMKHYGDDIENPHNNRASNFMSKEEAKRLEKAKKWTEKRLLKVMLIYITLPLFVLSLLAYWLPYIYTIVPVYESETCWMTF